LCQIDFLADGSNSQFSLVQKKEILFISPLHFSELAQLAVQ